MDYNFSNLENLIDIVTKLKNSMEKIINGSFHFIYYEDFDKRYGIVKKLYESDLIGNVTKEIRKCLYSNNPLNPFFLNVIMNEVLPIHQIMENFIYGIEEKLKNLEIQNKKLSEKEWIILHELWFNTSQIYNDFQPKIDELSNLCNQYIINQHLESHSISDPKKPEKKCEIPKNETKEIDAILFVALCKKLKLIHHTDGKTSNNERVIFLKEQLSENQLFSKIKIKQKWNNDTIVRNIKRLFNDNDLYFTQNEEQINSLLNFIKSD